jgi:hypothetical protein
MEHTMTARRALCALAIVAPFSNLFCGPQADINKFEMGRKLVEGSILGQLPVGLYFQAEDAALGIFGWEAWTRTRMSRVRVCHATNCITSQRRRDNKKGRGAAWNYFSGEGGIRQPGEASC